MKKKRVIIFWVVAMVILLYVANNMIEEKKYEEKYGDAFVTLFVTERNEVFFLYQAVGQIIELSDDESYENALAVAKKTEQVCMQTYGESINIGVVYNQTTVYYSTFYRDVKAALESKCDREQLQQMYDLLGEIIVLYDEYSNSVMTVDKRNAMVDFYEAIGLMNEELCLPFE